MNIHSGVHRDIFQKKIFSRPNVAFVWYRFFIWSVTVVLVTAQFSFLVTVDAFAKSAAKVLTAKVLPGNVMVVENDSAKEFLWNGAEYSLLGNLSSESQAQDFTDSNSARLTWTAVSGPRQSTSTEVVEISVEKAQAAVKPLASSPEEQAEVAASSEENVTVLPSSMNAFAGEVELIQVNDISNTIIFETPSGSSGPLSGVSPQPIVFPKLADQVFGGSSATVLGSPAEDSLPATVVPQILNGGADLVATAEVTDPEGGALIAESDNNLVSDTVSIVRSQEQSDEAFQEVLGVLNKSFRSDTFSNEPVVAVPAPAQPQLADGPLENFSQSASEWSTEQLISAPDLEYGEFAFDTASSGLTTSTPFKSARLMLSLANLSEVRGQLSFEYSLANSSWENLGQISLAGGESNATRGGYLTLDVLPVLLTHLDSLRLRVSFEANNTALSSVSSGAVLSVDGLWLEADYLSSIAESSASSTQQDVHEQVKSEPFDRIDFLSDILTLSMSADLSNPISITTNRFAASTLQMLIMGVSKEASSTRLGNTVTYHNAFPGTDVEYRFSERQLKENIILKDRNRPSEFSYLLNLEQYDYELSDNILKIYKPGHQGDDLYLLYTISAPVMTDSNGAESDSLVFSLSNNILTLTPDADWLSTAQYPVTVDPTVEISVLNVHSHPVAGDIWKVDFTTAGAWDLAITQADQVTIDETQFVSLSCEAEDRTAQVVRQKDGSLFVPGWSCESVASVSFEVTKTGNHHLVFEFGGITADAFNAALVWKGTVNSLWSNGANWSTGAKPTSADSVTFDNTCTNCNVTIDEAATTTSFTMASTYTGTIIQNSNANLSVMGAFSQSGGTFNGGAATTAYAGNVTISGGTYNASSNTSFRNTSFSNSTLNVNVTQEFDNLTFDYYGTLSISSGDTLVVNGTLLLTRATLDSGTIQAKGNIVQESTFSGGDSVGNVAVLDFANDAVAQVYTLNGGSGLNVRLDSAADANDSLVFNAAASLGGLNLATGFSGTAAIINPGNYDIGIKGKYLNSTSGFYQQAGTFQGGSWSLVMEQYGNFVITGGTFNAPSTTTFHDTSSGASVSVDVNSTATFNDLIINASGYGGRKIIIASGDTVIVNGLLTLTDGLLVGGIIRANGNVVQDPSFDGGESNGYATTLDFGNDSLAQTYTLNGGSGLNVRLDSAADANDSLVFNAAAPLGGLNLATGFSGIANISNPSNYDVTIKGSQGVGTSGFYQQAGTFQGGSWNLVMEQYANFVITGGTFNAPSTTIFHDTSTSAGVSVDVNSTATFNDLIINASGYGGRQVSIASGDTLVVNGTLTLTDGNVQGGIFDIRGNGSVEAGIDGLTSTLNFGNNGAAQTFTINGAYGPKLRYDNPADSDDAVVINRSVSLNGIELAAGFAGGTAQFTNPGNYTITVLHGDYVQACGTFQGGPWALAIYSDGIFVADFTISGGTFNAPSTTVFTGPYDGALDVNSSVTFENFLVNRPGRSVAIGAGDTIYVTATSTLTDGRLTGGTLSAQGDVVVGSLWDGGTTPLVFSGSNNQTFNLTGAAGLYNADITVDKNVGTVTLLSALLMDASSQDLTITSGTFDINGYNLTATGTSGTLKIQNGANLQLQGDEIITANTSYPQFQTGSTVTYDGASTYTLKNYSYSNLVIAGSGTFTPAVPTFNLLNFTQTSGTYNASLTTHIAGNFSHTGGIFNHSNGTVNLTGGNQSILGDTVFYNLTKSTSTAYTLTFASASTQTIENSLTLAGAVGQRLLLRSDSTGIQWNIDPRGTRTISYLDVEDSNNINAVVMNAAGTNSLSSGNNANWDFGTTFSQSAYRFFENVNLLQPSSALAGENTGITLTSTSSPIRLRVNLSVGSVDLATTSESFILQFSTATTSGWTSVGPAAAWQFYDNTAVTSGVTVSSVLLSGSTIQGSYMEENPTASNPFTVPAGQMVEYDFALDPQSTVAGTTYYFRMAKSNGTALDAFLNFPSLTLFTNNVPSVPGSLGTTSVIGGGWIATSTPSFTFTLTDPDVTDTVKYHIQISTSSDYSVLAVDYTSFLQSQGQATYTPESELPDNESYYWRVEAVDDSGATSSLAVASGGAVAFKVDTEAPEAGVLSASAASPTSLAVSVFGANDAGSGLSPTPYIFFNGTQGFVSSATSSSDWVFGGLVPNTRYTLYAQVSDGVGNATVTNSSNPYTLANVPSGVRVSPDSQTQLTVSWSDNGNPPGTEYYVLNVTASTTSGWVAAGSFAFTGLICNTAYEFTVKAKNGDGVETATTTAVSQTTAACSNPDTGGGSGGGGGGGGGGILPSAETYGLIINNGAATTSSAIVALNLMGGSSAKRMAISNSQDFAGEINETYRLMRPWSICDLTTCQPGTYTVYARFYSATGQLISEESDSIELQLPVSSVVVPPPDLDTLNVRLFASADNKHWSETLSGIKKGQKVGLRAEFLANIDGTVTVDFTCTPGGNVSRFIKKAKDTRVTARKLCSYDEPGTYIAAVAVSYGQHAYAAYAIIEVGETAVTPLDDPSTILLPPDATQLPSVTIGSPSQPSRGTDTLSYPSTSETEQNIKVVEKVSDLESVTKFLGLHFADIFEKVDSEIYKNIQLTKKIVRDKKITFSVLSGAGTVVAVPAILIAERIVTDGRLLVGFADLGSMWYVFLRYLYALLSFFGLRRKRRRWGTVYDSITKQPLDPVIVELMYADTDKRIEQSITDLQGRFGFLDKPGRFYIRVKKSHYQFPSKIITGKTDGIYENLYHGGVFAVHGVQGVISPNIPMDPMEFDWNQQDKQRLIKIHPIIERGIYGLLEAFFWAGAVSVGFVFALDPSLLNTVFFGLYGVMIVTHHRMPRVRLWGRVYSRTVNTARLLLELSPTRIPGVVTGKAVTSDAGRYFLKANPGEYILRIKQTEGEEPTVLKEFVVTIHQQGIYNKTIKLP